MTTSAPAKKFTPTGSRNKLSVKVYSRGKTTGNDRIGIYIPTHLQVCPTTGKKRKYIYFPSDDTYHAGNKEFLAFLREHVTDCTANMDADKLRKWIHTGWKLNETNPQALLAMQQFRPFTDGETILM